MSELKFYNIIEKNIGYGFADKELIIRALTHSSYANEHKNIKDNERLEFLGDSVLGFVVSDYIFKERRDIPEGELTKIRSKVVCEESLKEVADVLGIADTIRLGYGEKTSGSRGHASIVADAVEAIIAAVYLDGGIKCARDLILRFFMNKIDNALHAKNLLDYKSRLQELVQSKTSLDIKYELISQEGPDHSRTFHMKVCQGGKTLGVGSGSSKKAAQQDAAKNALENYK